MRKINDWLLHEIKKDADSISEMPLHWMEIMRADFSPIITRALRFIIEENGTFLLCADSRRAWFKTYILHKLNSLDEDRPYISIYDFDASLSRLLSSDEMNNDLIKNTLDISYNKYAIWYIGDADTKMAKFALEFKESFLWIFDKKVERAIMLKNDKNADIKLIQLYRIFEEAIFVGISGDYEF